MRNTMKLPTDEDYRSYDGAHCSNLWRSLDEEWRCPACKRSKFQILRWTKRYFKSGVGKCAPYFGWIAGLHTHHDHSQPFLSNQGRFAETIICDQCNSADGTVKRRLRLPRNFSFSPSEISCFVRIAPHDRHRIDFAEAQRIYDDFQPSNNGS